MADYSEQDLKYAAEFREDVHKEALAIVRKTRPHVTEVLDRHPVEDYFQEHWDYPGKWYTIVAIPYGYKSRKALVDQLVRDTLSGKASGQEPPYTQVLRDMVKKEPGRRKLTNQLDAKPDGYEELFVVEQKNGDYRAVGTDSEGRYILEHFEEYNVGDATASTGTWYVLTDLEYARYARMSLLNGQLKEEDYFRLTAMSNKAPDRRNPFFVLLDEYPDLVVEYSIVKCETGYADCESHRKALKTAFRELGEGWKGEPDEAAGNRISAGELFAPIRKGGNLNYRKAFLKPPHTNRYTDRDFDRVNEVLFPKGTDKLEVYEWTTDWSDYFDDGHEWWGTLCITVYDPTLDRFVVIMASATD